MSQRRSTAFVMTALALSGCGGAATPAPNGAFTAEPPSADRLVTTHPTTPLAFRSFAFDYGALPFLDPVAPSEALPDASFAITQEVPGRYSLVMTGGLVAQIEVGDLRIVRGVEGGAPAERTLVPSGSSVCGRNMTSLARWQGYVRDGSTPDELTFACYEGTFDGRSCTVVARRAWKVRAPRLADGGVFGFRSIEGACRLRPHEREPETLVGHQERLDIVGPRPIWVGSTDSRGIGATSPEAPFSRVSIPVFRGGSSSVVVDVSATDLLSVLRNAPPGAAELSYSFDVVWPEGARAPSATAFVSVIRGEPANIAPPPNTHYDFAGG